MPTPTNALITLDDLKDELVITNTEHDDKLERIILAVTRGIENACGGRTFIAQTESAKKLDGDGTTELLVKFPVISVSSLSNNGTTVVETTNYELYENKGLIVLTDGTVWASGRKKITITYRHGYEYDDLPEAIKRAAMLWASKLFQDISNKRFGVTSVSRGDETISYEKGIPQEALDLIMPYHVGFAGERWAV